MGRDPDVAAGVEERVEAADEVRAHRLVVGERDRPRLQVDALAEADARPEVGQRVDVVERAPQPRLEHDAEVLVPVLAELAIEAERVVGRRRVLHVDPDEVPVAGRGAYDVEEVFAAEVVRQLEPERGELDADVRVESGLVDRGEDVTICLSDRAGLLLARDLLAQHVDGGHLPAAVQLTDTLDGLRQRCTRRCSARRRAAPRASAPPAAGGRGRSRPATRARRFYAADRRRLTRA